MRTFSQFYFVAYYINFQSNISAYAVLVILLTANQLPVTSRFQTVQKENTASQSQAPLVTVSMLATPTGFVYGRLIRWKCAKRGKAINLLCMEMDAPAHCRHGVFL